MTNSSIISDIIIESTRILVEAGQSNGYWYMAFVVFAILGATSLISSIIFRVTEAITIFIKIFIFIPSIVIVNLFNKKKRKERLKVWGEFKEQAKKENKKVSKKMWVFWLVVKIILPILTLIFIVWEFFL